MLRSFFVIRYSLFVILRSSSSSFFVILRYTSLFFVILRYSSLFFVLRPSSFFLLPLLLLLEVTERWDESLEALRLLLGLNGTSAPRANEKVGGASAAGVHAGVWRVCSSRSARRDRYFGAVNGASPPSFTPSVPSHTTTPSSRVARRVGEGVSLRLHAARHATPSRRVSTGAC